MRILPILCASLLLSGCANFNKTTTKVFHTGYGYQRIFIDTPGVENAKCELAVANKVYNVNTPSNVRIRKSSKGGALKVTCKHDSYQTVHKEISPRLAARGWWPVLNKDVYNTGEKNGNFTHYPDVINIEFPTIHTLRVKEMYVKELKADEEKVIPPANTEKSHVVVNRYKTKNVGFFSRISNKVSNKFSNMKDGVFGERSEKEIYDEDRNGRYGMFQGAVKPNSNNHLNK